MITEQLLHDAEYIADALRVKAGRVLAMDGRLGPDCSSYFDFYEDAPNRPPKRSHVFQIDVPNALDNALSCFLQALQPLVGSRLASSLFHLKIVSCFEPDDLVTFVKLFPNLRVLNMSSRPQFHGALLFALQMLPSLRYVSVSVPDMDAVGEVVVACHAAQAMRVQGGESISIEVESGIDLWREVGEFFGWSAVMADGSPKKVFLICDL